MVTINDVIYRDIAALLLTKLEGKDFFNGTVEYDTDEFYSVLHCTLIVCRSPSTDRILSVLPVWWEYNLYMSDGEQLTDFSWNELNGFLEIC